MPHFAILVTLFIIVENNKNAEKVRKIGQNEAFQEEKYNDKNTIHLPRQYTGNSLKSLDLSGKGKLHSSVLDQV